MAKTKGKNIVLSVSLLLLWFVPIISLAFGLWLPQSTPCQPPDAFSSTDIQNCEYNYPGANNVREIDLKWNVSTKGTGTQVCGLGCKKEDGSECSGFMFKDGQGAGTSTITNTKLHPKDNVTVNDPSLKAGNTYQAVCCALSDPNSRGSGILNQLFNACQSDTITYSQKMVITESGTSGSCEVSWSNIEEGLKEDKPFHVTEVNLSDWITKIQEEDFSKYGAGSGDNRDISDYMIGGQCDYTACLLGKGACPKPTYFNSKFTEISPMDPSWVDKLASVEKRVNIAGLPIGLGLRALNWPVSINNGNRLIYSSHLVILVGMGGSADSGYNFEIIDSNIPDRVSSVTNCKYAKMEITSSGIKASPTGFKCDPLDPSVYPAEDGPIFVFSFEDSYDQSFLAFYDFCQNSTNQVNYKDLCGRDKGKSSINQWLRDNLTGFSNINYENGTCKAWTDFFIKTAFLGDFVGTDYHSGDGKIVGRDCDANHYPIGAKKTILANSWLANIWSAWQGIF